jgi:hypothetical protein
VRRRGFGLEGGPSSGKGPGCRRLEGHSCNVQVGQRCKQFTIAITGPVSEKCHTNKGDKVSFMMHRHTWKSKLVLLLVLGHGQIGANGTECATSVKQNDYCKKS